MIAPCASLTTPVIPAVGAPFAAPGAAGIASAKNAPIAHTTRDFTCFIAKSCGMDDSKRPEDFTIWECDVDAKKRGRQGRLTASIQRDVFVDRLVRAGGLLLAEVVSLLTEF